MPTSGRSADDLPLAAYSTGVDPQTEPDELGALVGSPPAVTELASAAAEAVLQLGSLDEATPPVPEDEPDPSSGPAASLSRARALAARNPRVAAGSGFAVVIALGLLLLLSGGRGPSAVAATAPPTGSATQPITVDPGSATLVLTGGMKGSYTMAGTAAQPVTGAQVGAAWADRLQDVLALTGPIDRGTRTTDARLILAWGVMVDGKLVSFTSKAGECTIGMASTPSGVSGSFACRKVRSDDGKVTVEASGTYRI